MITEVAKCLVFPSHPELLSASVSPEKGQCCCFGRSNPWAKWAEKERETVVQDIT